MHLTAANASNADTPPAISPPSPYLDTPSVSAVLLPLLALITVMLDTPCFLWHLTSRNAAASMLVGWVMLENVIVLINGVLWPTDDMAHWWHGQGYCDVAVKLDFAAGYAIGACALCIMRALASALDTKRQQLSASLAARRRATLLLYALTVGLPLYSVVAAFIVQPQRYYIVAISGCAMAERNAGVMVALCYAPLVLLMATTAGYAALVLLRLHRYRRDLAAVLASTESGLSRTRFLRLLGLALVVLLVYTPLFLYIVYVATVANRMYPFDWDVVHDPSTWNTIVLVQSFGAARVERWVRPTLGVVVFACFGFGRDIRGTYCKCFRSVGLGRMVERLRLDEEDNSGAAGWQDRGAPGRNRRAKQHGNSSSNSFGLSGFKGRARRVISKLSLSSSLGSTSSSYSRNTDSVGSDSRSGGSGARHSPHKTVFVIDEELTPPISGPGSTSMQQQQRLQDGPYELAGSTYRATGLLERALYENDGTSGIGSDISIAQEKHTIDSAGINYSHVNNGTPIPDKDEEILQKYHGSMRPVRIHTAQQPSPTAAISTPPPTYQQAASLSSAVTATKAAPSCPTIDASGRGTATDSIVSPMDMMPLATASSANFQQTSPAAQSPAAHPSFTSRFWARLGSYVQCMPQGPAPLTLGGYAGGYSGGGAGLGMGLIGRGYGHAGAGAGAGAGVVQYHVSQRSNAAASRGQGYDAGERRDFERHVDADIV